MRPTPIYQVDFFVNLSYKLSGTYNLVNQVSKKNMFSQKQIKLAKKQIWNNHGTSGYPPQSSGVSVHKGPKIHEN